MHRPLAAVLIASTLGACAYPRTSIATGTVAAVAGALIVASPRTEPSCDPTAALGCLGQTFARMHNNIEIGGGIALLAGAAALVVAGVIGLEREAAPPPPPAFALPIVEPPPPAPTPAGSDAPYAADVGG